MIVVDTNVITALYWQSDATEASQQALRSDEHWIAPHLWRSEFRNVLATLMRVGRCNLVHALQVLDAAERLMSDREYTVPGIRVMQLAEQSRCSAYDCEFVALAEEMNTLLITLDQPLQRAFPTIAIPLEAFIATSPEDSDS